ncbi:MAG: helix-turn-helix domain-containing protein [Chloroflexota bacterium]|nr:helix-turn-helix domain-containing protein [Chloroflexota bacterium]
MGREPRSAKRGPAWNAYQVKALRHYLGLTQEQMAEELGTRQQTISEWERGQYRPRGTSARLLTLVAERAGFPYQVGQGSGVEGEEEKEST